MDENKWHAEFKKVFTGLFVDPDNGLDVQLLRLKRLAAASQTEARLAVPIFLLEEGLSRGRRKASTAAGKDQVSWSALSSLPLSARLLLAELFESRVNGDEGWSNKIDAWATVMVKLIPKKVSPTRVGGLEADIFVQLCAETLFVRGDADG